MLYAVAGVVWPSYNAGGQAAHLGGAALGYYLFTHPWTIAWADRGNAIRWGFRLPRRNSAGRPVANVWKPTVYSTPTSRRVSEEELDRILDKVHNRGMHTLTDRERERLRQASQERKEKS